MSNYLPTDYQTFIHKSRYARWLDDLGRRETWPETVTRYVDNVVRPALEKANIATTRIKKLTQEVEQSMIGLQQVITVLIYQLMTSRLSMRLCSSCSAALVLASP